MGSDSDRIEESSDSTVTLGNAREYSGTFGIVHGNGKGEELWIVGPYSITLHGVRVRVLCGGAFMREQQRKRRGEKEDTAEADDALQLCPARSIEKANPTSLRLFRLGLYSIHCLPVSLQSRKKIRFVKISSFSYVVSYYYSWSSLTSLQTYPTTFRETLTQQCLKKILQKTVAEV